LVLNPAKPVAAFIEYTLKPLLDDAYELVLLMEDKGFRKADLALAFWLFIAQIVFDFAKTLLVTGMICLTILRCLHTSL
jgi:hypothetical protein